MGDAVRVAVVGAGPVGASVAWWLSTVGCDLRIYEAGVAGGEGACRHSGGMTRHVDPDPVLDRLSRLGSGVLDRWNALGLPGPSPLRRVPLWWLLDEGLADVLQRRLREQERDGVRHAVLLTREQAQRAAPALRTVRAERVLHDPHAGVCDTRLLVRNLLWGAQERGARLYEHCPVRVARGAGGGVECRAAHGGHRIEADVTVLAMGQGLPHTIGDTPRARRSVPQVQVTDVPALPGALIDAASGTYLRPGADGDAFVGWSGPRLHDGQTAMPDLAVATSKLRLLADSLGWSRMPEVLGLVPGTDAYTEDLRPLLEWGADGGTCLVGALSGRGLKYATLLGACVADALARRVGLPRVARLQREIDAAREVLEATARETVDAC